MALTRELSEMACRLGKCAVLARSDAMLDLERSVCGCDYGSTGGTTRLEAERIAQLLELRPGTKLLDLGAGSGWPGLYLGQLTGCDVVMVDLPLAALRIARERAAADGLAQRCEAVVADGAALPFRDASFDALNTIPRSFVVRPTSWACCGRVGVSRAMAPGWRSPSLPSHPH
jgi:protein-L-isoaspartate O-methyltransferase